MTSVPPEAVVDTLAVVAFLSGEANVTSLPPSRRPVAHGEVHVFSYLSCLLSLYQQQPVASWGYEFVRAGSGLPFAGTIPFAIDSLVGRGLVERTTNEGLLLTSRGRDALSSFLSLDRMRNRIEVMRAACNAAITLPPGAIHDALQEEPGLRVAGGRALNATLGSDGATEVLYSHFRALHRAFGTDVEELFLPAMAWLTYLAESFALEQDYEAHTEAAGPNAA